VQATATDGTTSVGSATVSFTVTNSTVSDKNRFKGKLGLQQPAPSGKTNLDVINDQPNSHAAMLRVVAEVPAGGNWSYGYYDQIFTAAKAKGMKIMLLDTYTPLELGQAGWVASWGNAVATYPRDPAKQDTWVSYSMKLVSYLAQKYPDTLVAVEICNEPNGWEFGAASGKYPVDPVAYVSLLKKMYTAMQAQTPNVLAITGGTAPAPTDGKQMAPNDWYTKLKSLGAAPGTHFDHVGVHLYDGVNATYSQRWDVIAPLWPTAQLWATEQGVGGDNPSWVGSNIDAFRAKAQAGAWLEFTEYDRTSAASGFDGFGLCRYDGTRKASFAEFAKRAAA
jgi:hypothetical protein